MREFYQFLDGFKAGMKDFGGTITVIVNSILLLIVYIFAVGPTSITAKIVGKKFLNKRIEPRKKTYWKKLGLKKEPMENYYRQF